MREQFFQELQHLISQPALKSAVESRAAFRAPSTLNEDELCRQAILRIGTEEQFSSSSHALLLAKSLYPQVRDALLLAGSWTWAMKSITVVETLPRPEYKWAYRYSVPSDCLRCFRVNDWDAASSDTAWEILGNYIYTNADSGSPAWVIDRAYEVNNAVSNKGAVYKCRVANTTKEPGVTTGWQTDWDVWLGSAITLEYVRKVTDVTLFDSLFIDLLTANLAAKLAVPLTGDANKAALLSKEVDVLGKNPAMRRDSTERKGKIKPAWTSSKLVSSRSGGDGIDQAKATAGGPGGGVSYPSLLVTVGSVTNLPTGATPTVSNTGTGNTAVLNFGLPQGPAGTVNIGTTTTGAEGTNASVVATGTPENRILSFTIPRGNTGNTGPQGQAATVAVGTVTTGNPGTSASVTNAGTSGDAVLNFAIPRGDVGATGPANSLAIGTVTTGTAGTPATATITGTAPSQTLSLSIPRGADATVAVDPATITGVAGSSASVANVGTPGAAIFKFTIPRGDAGLGNAFYSITPPAAPSSGDLWWDTANKRLYVYQTSNWAEVNGNNDEFPVVDADAARYVTEVEAADIAAGFTGGLEQGVKDAFMMFVINAKLDGIWDAIKASCIMAGARSLNGALVPLKGTAPTNINFMQADYDRKTGLIGDGVGKYLNTNYLEITENQDNKHISALVRQVSTTLARGGILGGSMYSNGSSFLNDPKGGWVYAGISANTKGQFHTGNLTPSLFGVSRNNSANFITRRNGVNLTATLTSQAFTNSSATYKVFANSHGVPTATSDARISFYSIGEFIDLQKLENHLNTLNSRLNTAIV